MIPMFLRLVAREDESNRNGLNLWLPLFLIWIVLLPLFVLLVVIWFFSFLAARTTGSFSLTAKRLEAAGAIIWNLNGLRINVRNRESRFVLHF